MAEASKEDLFDLKSRISVLEKQNDTLLQQIKKIEGQNEFLLERTGRTEKQTERIFSRIDDLFKLHLEPNQKGSSHTQSIGSISPAPSDHWLSDTLISHNGPSSGFESEVFQKSNGNHDLHLSFPDKDDGFINVYENGETSPLPPPLEQLKAILPELTSDMDGLAVLPHLEKVIPIDDVSTIEATQERTSRNGEILRSIMRSFHCISDNNFTCYNELLKALAGLHPDLFEKLQYRSPTANEADFCVEGFVQDMKKAILENGHVRDNKMDEVIDLDEKFIQLELATGRYQDVNEDHMKFGHDGKVPVYYQAHMDRRKENFISSGHIANFMCCGQAESAQRNLLCGRAGIGKSTTLQWLLRQWAKGSWGQGFTIVFLIPIRILLTCDVRISLVELLKSYTLYKTSMPANRLLSSLWLRNNDVRVMLQVDGLDEISDFSARMRNTPIITKLEENAHPLTLCINILRGNLLKRSTLVCTSRHFLGLCHLKDFEQFEILGLSQDGVKLYIDHTFYDDAHMIKLVLMNNPVLMSICAITYYCTVITRLLHEDPSLSEKDVKTYTRLQCFIIKRFASRNLNEATFSLEGLSKLARLAYKGIFEVPTADECVQIIFTEDDLTSVDIGREDLKEAVDRGLLLCNDREGSPPSVEFFHLSVQELLSVASVLSDRNVDDGKFGILLDTVSTDDRFNMVLLYMFGLYYDIENPLVNRALAAVLDGNSPSQNPTIKIRLKKSLLKLIDRMKWDMQNDDLGDVLHQIGWGTHCSNNKLQLCLMAHESQESDIANCIMDIVIDRGELEMEWCLITAVDMMALTFTSKYSEYLYKISLKHANIDDASASLLAQFLATNSTVTHLDLSSNQIKTKGLSALGNMLAMNTVLRSLIIDCNKIEDSNMEGLLPGLCASPSLEMLSFSDNCISDSTAIELAKQVNKLDHRWTRLNLPKNFITHNGANMLIQKAQELGINLDLSNNFIDKEKLPMTIEYDVEIARGDVDFVHVLQKCQSSKMIHLSDANVFDDDMNKLATCIIGHENMVELNLQNNNLTTASLPLLSTFAFTCPKLECINLVGNSIDKGIIDAFLDLQFRRDVEVLRIRRGNTKSMLGDWKNVILIPFGMDTRWFNGLESVLQKRSSLSELHFLSETIKCLDSQQMSNILRYNEALSTLVINGINLSDWQCVAAPIQNMKSLKRLQVKDCSLTTNSSEELLNVFCRSTSLTSFELSGPGARNYIGSETLKKMSDTIKMNNTLTHMYLDDQPIGDKGAEHISLALKENKKLSTLSLKDNKITEQGAKYISQALAENTTLQTINLSKNILGVAGVKHICRGLHRNFSLHALNLANTDYKGKGIEYISDMITRNKTLKELNIASSVVVSAEYGRLREAVSRNNSLVKLDVPRITTPGLASDIAKYIERNRMN